MDRVPATETKQLNPIEPIGRLCPIADDADPQDDVDFHIRRAGVAWDLKAEQCAPKDSHALRQSHRHFEQISAAARSFSLQLDLQKLLAEVAFFGHDILRSDQVIAYSHIDKGLRQEAVYPSNTTTDEHVPDDVPWCIRYLKAKVTNEYPGDQHNIRNSICVPFVASQNRALGVLEFRNKLNGGLFTEHDANVATCLARVATSAVERAMLFFRIEEWKQSIETLLSFNATVNQQLEPEQMVRELVTNVIGFLEADGGASGLVLRNVSGATLQCNGFYFASKWHPYVRKWKKGEGIPGVVLEREFPHLVADYSTDPLSDSHLASEFQDLQYCICVPIKNRHEEVLGFFQLFRRSGQPAFTWQDAAFLESLGNTAAVAIENAGLVKSLEVKNAQIKTLSQEHVLRLEEERQHIARELHDETGQVLVGLKLKLKLLDGLLTTDQNDARCQLAELRLQLSRATAQLKDMAKRLRPPTLDELGFEASIRQLVVDFRSQAEFDIELEFDSTAELTGTSETALFRIVQECLTNAAKHANATNVKISFRRADNRQVLRIVDDGNGFDMGKATNGLGHVGVKERVRMLGGCVDVRSSIGKGVTVEVTLGPNHE